MGYLMTVEELLRQVRGTRLTEQRSNVLVKVAKEFAHPDLIEAESISDCVSWLLKDIKDDTPYDFFGLQIYQNVRNLIKSGYLEVAQSNEQPFVSITDLGLAYLRNHRVISERLFTICLAEGVSQSFNTMSSETLEYVLELEKINSKVLKLERSHIVRHYLHLTDRRNYLQTKVNDEENAS